jgi:hypothetical protein
MPVQLAGNWRHVLADDPMNARPIITSLLKGRVTMTPLDVKRRRWMLKGEGSLFGLFQRAIEPRMSEVSSPRYGVPKGTCSLP